MAHENKYEERFKYAKRFVEGKTINPDVPQSESEVVRDLYVEILKYFPTIESAIKPYLDVDSEYAYRSGLWSLVAGLITTANMSDTTEEAKIHMDAAEELVAILTTHFPKD